MVQMAAPASSSYTRPEYGSSSYLDSVGRAQPDYDTAAYAPVSYAATGSRLDLSGAAAGSAAAARPEDVSRAYVAAARSAAFVCV